MQVIRNRFIPVKGFRAMALYPFLFVRNDVVLYDRTVNHEMIHFEQQKEMFLIGFYIWYVLEWLVKLPVYGKKAYRNISFEREAYGNENDKNYPAERKKFNWVKYI